MSNFEIIGMEASVKGIEWTGTELYTFQEWKKRGYSVKKGSKAIITTSLWKHTTKKDKDGNEKKSMFLTKASLFHISQVEKITAN